MPHYTLEPGRIIFRDSEPVAEISVANYKTLSAAEADRFAHEIVAALNFKEKAGPVLQKMSEKLKTAINIMEKKS